MSTTWAADMTRAEAVALIKAASRLDDLLKRLYGPRRFRPFVMPT